MFSLLLSRYDFSTSFGDLKMLSLLILYRFADHGSRGTDGHDRDQRPVSRKSRNFSGAFQET